MNVVCSVEDLGTLILKESDINANHNQAELESVCWGLCWMYQ
jgi:hypothetical protein